jgi:hypothetical protein
MPYDDGLLVHVSFLPSGSARIDVMACLIRLGS